MARALRSESGTVGLMKGLEAGLSSSDFLLDRRVLDRSGLVIMGVLESSFWAVFKSQLHHLLCGFEHITQPL